MGKNITNINYLPIEVDCCDQSVSVSSDIEYVVRHDSVLSFDGNQVDSKQKPSSNLPGG